MATLPEIFIVKKTEESKTKVTYEIVEPTTNGDRLRAMNNEELCNEYFRILNHVLPRYTDSRAGLLEWLKQPAE